MWMEGAVFEKFVVLWGRKEIYVWDKPELEDPVHYFLVQRLFQLEIHGVGKIVR